MGFGGTPEETVRAIAVAIIAVCVGLLIAAVVLNFALAAPPGRARRERRSWVATHSMTTFFVVLSLLISRRIGEVAIPHLPNLIALTAVGVTLVAVGCAVNLLGRLQLGANWANQATVYEDQTLVSTGVFGLVRHPLYASLMWMAFGSAIAFHNPLAAALTALVFVPMMHHRAALEERLLAEAFPEYAAYCRRVPRFTPRLFGGSR